MFGNFKFLAVIFVSVFLLLNIKTAFTQTTAKFLAPRAYDGGIGFATGDFNNDGRLDIISVKTDRINLLLGNQHGIFTEPSTTVFACQGFSYAFSQPLVGDYNNDGRIDIAAWVEDNSCTGRGARTLMVLPGNGNGSFSAPIYNDILTSFFTPTQFATRDFNGDGRPDIALAAALTGEDKVAIFICNGNGTFAAPAIYDIGNNDFTTMAVGDFNNDNRPDFVFARRSPADLIIVPNNGNGTFGAPQTISSFTYIKRITEGDFNGDGNLDFIAIQDRDFDPIVQVWLGNGNNTFSSGGTFTITFSGYINTLLSGDYNNDGRQDFALSISNRTLIFNGNGNGTFVEDERYAVGGGKIFKGDFNNDGWTDLATAQTLGSQGSAISIALEFTVLPNLQNGKFLTAPELEIPFGGEELAIADFNNDGLKDIAATGDSLNGEIALYLQDPNALLNRSAGRSKFASRSRMSAEGFGMMPFSIATGDFNQDNKTDVVVAGHPPSGMTENVLVARNDGAGNLTLLTTLSVGGTVTKVITGDFNNDNILDLAFAKNSTSSPTTVPVLAVALGVGGGMFAAPVGYMTANLGGTGIAKGNFNGDTFLDLAVTLSNRKVVVFLNNGSGAFSEGASYDLPVDPTDIATADLHSDGKMDLIVANSFFSARISVFAGNGNGTFSAPVNYLTVSLSYVYNEKLTVDDFNGDGKLDVATTNNGVITILENNGSGNLNKKTLWASTGALRDIASADLDNDQKTDLVTSSAVNAFYNISFLPNITSPVGNSYFDFDGDGKTDLSIFRPSNGQWWYQQSSNNNVKAFAFGTSTDKIVPADYDGDGKTDIAFFRPSTGEWFVLRSSNNTFYAAPFGVSTDTPAPGDFDGDGKADLTVYRSSTGTWYILRSTDSTVFAVPFGTSQDIPTVADYDGDGKSDIAIFRPTGGSGNAEWWIQRSTAGLFATPFGTSTDKPVPADYTGDGKADVAFWRPTTGEWFVLRSEDLSFYAAPFGTSTDIPVAGDYDGDGKGDLAVFRPSSATWFALKTTGGTLIQQFGATGDIPVPSAFVP
jgi:hypothetical protein